MKTQRKHSLAEALKAHLLSISFFAIITAIFLGGLSDAEASSDAERKKLLEDSVRKAVVSCYALEGRYPESVEYLEKNYKFFYDRDRYKIGYSIFASNVMPDIYVIDWKEEEQKLQQEKKENEKAFKKAERQASQ